MFDVIIIGAGLAGLSCAATLKKESPSLRILIVEARPRIGGRVYPSHLLTNHSVELGAEYIQGEHAILEQFGIPTVPLTECNSDTFSLRTTSGKGGYYYLGHEARLISTTTCDDPDIVHLHEVIHTMKSNSLPTSTVLDYVVKQGVKSRVLGLVQTGSATRLQFLPQQKMKINKQESTIHNVLSFCSVIAHLRKGVEIWTEWAVKEIEWQTNIVRLISEKNEIIVAKHIVVTPSVAVLKSGLMTFSPPLPWRRMQLYQSIQMEPCIKIAFVFHTRFVPDDFQGILCADCPVPEFWDSSSSLSSSSEFVLMAFATASSAFLLSRLSMLELQQTVLKQLDRMFRTDCMDKPATNAYCNMMVQDWTKDKYIGGGYSLPSFYIEETDRHDMASSINRTIYFAGEATSATRYMTVQGAMESGSRAAQEIIREHTRKNSKL